MQSGYVAIPRHGLLRQDTGGYNAHMRAPAPKKLTPIAIRLDPDVRAGLEVLAKADDRTLSAYVHRVLKQHVERERAKAERKGA